MTWKADPIRADAFGEAGNIGAGRAAAALEFYLGETGSLSPPRVGAGVRPLSAIEIGLRLEGSLRGEILLNLNPHSVHGLLTHLRGVPPQDLTRLHDMETSALCEIGNVLGCAYITALSDLTGLRFEPTVPHLRLGGRIHEATEEVWVASRVQGRDAFELDLVLTLDGASLGKLLQAMLPAA